MVRWCNGNGNGGVTVTQRFRYKNQRITVVKPCIDLIIINFEGNIQSQIQQRGGLLNFFQAFFSSKNPTSATTSSASNPSSKTPNKSAAYMQQKTLNREFHPSSDTKSSPKQQTKSVTPPSNLPSSPSSSTSVTSSSSASSSQNSDNINLDEYETVNIDPNDDAPEYVSLTSNAAVKRRPKKI